MSQQLPSGSASAPVDAQQCVERVVNEPVIHEHVHKSERDEFQAEIEKDIYKEQVRQIVQPIRETLKEPDVLVERELRGEERIYEESRNAELESQARSQLPRSEIDVAPTEVERVVHQPIVHEHLHTTIREEITPVIERDVESKTIVLEKKPIHETYVEAPRFEGVEYRSAITPEEAERQGLFQPGQQTYCPKP